MLFSPCFWCPDVCLCGATRRCRQKIIWIQIVLNFIDLWVNCFISNYMSYFQKSFFLPCKILVWFSLSWNLFWILFECKSVGFLSFNANLSPGSQPPSFSVFRYRSSLVWILLCWIPNYSCWHLTLLLPPSTFPNIF